jgi:glucose-6-phosphate 1-dehydrogenase
MTETRDGSPTHGARDTAPPALVVIFGATGDLTRRKILPAIHSLSCSGVLSPQTRVVGAGRTMMDPAAFRAQLYEGIESYARMKADPHLCQLWSQFETHVDYVTANPETEDGFDLLVSHIASIEAAVKTDGNILFYLAVPPSAVCPITQRLHTCGLLNEQNGWRRVVIEKPFGRDLRSARELNASLEACLGESQIYRIDHFLGKETVQNILSVRFANAVFEPLWSRDFIDHVQITAAESLGVGERSGYYDEAGVLRDTVQNHLLQLVALTAMDFPNAIRAKTLRDQKVAVFRAIRPLTPGDVVLGQYDGYRLEQGVAAASQTPTFAALRLRIDNPRWQGVPFHIRTGKYLESKETQITLQFRSVSHPLFEGAKPPANRLTIHVQPVEGVQIQFNTKIPGAGLRTQPVEMTFDYSDRFGDGALADAYERLLLDALRGDPTLFIRADEIEACWSILDPLLQSEGSLPVHAYPAGSWGPVATETLFMNRTKDRSHPSEPDGA